VGEKGTAAPHSVYIYNEKVTSFVEVAGPVQNNPAGTSKKGKGAHSLGFGLMHFGCGFCTIISRSMEKKESGVKVKKRKQKSSLLVQRD